MNYELTDYQGNKLSLNPEQAQKIANVSELIEVTVNGQTHYLNPKNIASIKPTAQTEADLISKDLRLARPDHRGQASPAKELLRKKMEALKQGRNNGN